MKRIFTEPTIEIEYVEDVILMSVEMDWQDGWGDEWNPYGIVE